MSLSKEERLQSAADALTIMLQELGDGAAFMREFSPEDPKFANIQKTTWKYLEDNFLVKGQRTLTSVDYELTGYGWRKALEGTGADKDADYHGRLRKPSTADREGQELGY